MEIERISSYIDLKDLEGLKYYIDDTLCDRQDQNLVLLTAVNTLIFNNLYKSSPKNSLKIFEATTDAICIGDYCLEFINDYYTPIVTQKI